MTITLGKVFIRVLVAVLLTMFCAACGVPTLVEDNQGSHKYQDSLLVSVVLNDTVFTEQEIREFIRLDEAVYPMLRPTPQFDSLQRASRPIATLTATNLASIPIRVPLAYWNSRRGLAYDYLPAVYSIGNAMGTLTPSRKPNIVVTGIGDSPILWYTDRRFVTILPNQTLVLEDSIDVLSLSAVIYDAINYPPGLYWVAFTYSNNLIRQGKSNYWTGRVNADTVYFRIK